MFLWWVDYALKEKGFDLANVIFAPFFILRGSDTHIDFLRFLIVSGRHDIGCRSVLFDLFEM